MVVEDDVVPDIDELLPAPEAGETFGVDLEDYTNLQRRYIQDLISRTEDLSEYNLTGKVKRFEPNLVVVTNIYSGKLPTKVGDDWYQPHLQAFHGPNCMVDLVEYLRAYNRGNCYAFAHNGSGFDGKFIFEAVTKIDGLSQSPILRGTNFLSLTVKRDHSGHKTRFYDSMLHLPGSLARLLKGWFSDSPQPNLAGGKGYFPHRFNTEANKGYKGLIPHIDMFDSDNLPLGKGADKFKAANDLRDWHAEQTGEWDFDKELLKYCNMDVIGLAALLNMYMSVSIPKGGIPLLKTTAPSFVHELYLQRTVEDLVSPELNMNVLKAQVKAQDPGLTNAEIKRMAFDLRADNNQKHVDELVARSKVGWPVLKSTEYNFVRRSLRGGRTVTSDSFMELTDEEKAQGIRILYQVKSFLILGRDFIVPR